MSDDNNNLFPTLTNKPKVFKFCMGQPLDKIFTTSINQITESLSENLNTQVQNDCIYPKPTNNEVYIKYNELIESEVKIYDIAGRVEMTILLPQGENKTTIDIEKLSSGVYMYKHIVAGKLEHSGKLIKE
jgi:hypothetical protein